MHLNVQDLLVDDTPGTVNDERKRLHAARLNSMHLRQPVGGKKMLQLAFEEVERLLEHAAEQEREIVLLNDERQGLWAEVEEARRAGFFTRLWRRIF